MPDEVHFEAIMHSRLLDGLVAGVEAQHPFKRQEMNATQVKVGVRRRKPVQMGAADRREYQRVRMGIDLTT